MKLERFVLPLVSVIGISVFSFAQVDPTRSDSAAKINQNAAGPKPYKEVITSDATSDSGLIIIHKVKDRFFFEIPLRLMNKPILVVSRIAKGAADVYTRQSGYAGDLINEKVIEFARGPGSKLFIRANYFSDVAKDSSENGLFHAMSNSNLLPIVAAFDIKAFSLDSANIVIDANDYINGDNNVIFFYDIRFKLRYYFLGALQPDKSYVETIKSFPSNVEIKTVKTYTKTNEDRFVTYGINTSFVLLPNEIMHVRYRDNRIGYFATQYRDFDTDPQSVTVTNLITRWRLEPRAVDIEKYKRGELVEPEKPIVYYIDPATPRKWVPYLIQGINDWQKAFEKAGFKHAIYALEAPVNDPDWSLEDARHNALVYKPSMEMNASGPHLHDPRSGEILETHINWYHNVMQLLHDWYFIQAAAIDPKARKAEFDDSLMGQLIRFVSSHEVGHTLGLRHNFGASSTVPVDSLRNKNWVEANGHTPSIMDYARFNYVAQPEDSISVKGIFPRIGKYDEWAIEWGYRWFPNFKTKEEEKAYLNDWVVSRLSSDKKLWFGSEVLDYDPRCQSEDLGDDAMKAGMYGIKNLQRIEDSLFNWVYKSGEDYSLLERMQNALFEQYKRYLIHVAKNVGGILRTEKTMDQKGSVIEFVSREKQVRAVSFLGTQLFKTPKWILDSKMFSMVGRGGVYQLVLLQQDILKKLLNHPTFTNLLFFETNKPGSEYTTGELLADVKNNIWQEIELGSPIDLYRRNLQKAHAVQLIALLNDTDPDSYKGNNSITINALTDILSIIRNHISGLINNINKALPSYCDSITRIHLKDIAERLRTALKRKNNS